MTGIHSTDLWIDLSFEHLRSDSDQFPCKWSEIWQQGLPDQCQIQEYKLQACLA
jgi:hypothetical protein